VLVTIGDMTKDEDEEKKEEFEPQEKETVPHKIVK